MASFNVTTAEIQDEYLKEWWLASEYSPSDLKVGKTPQNTRAEDPDDERKVHVPLISQDHQYNETIFQLIPGDVEDPEVPQTIPSTEAIQTYILIQQGKPDVLPPYTPTMTVKDMHTEIRKCFPKRSDPVKETMLPCKSQYSNIPVRKRL